MTYGNPLACRARPSILERLPAWLNIISALMIRDALKRYGHKNFGFFWIVFEPLLFTVGVMVLWSFSGEGKGHDVAVIPFALTAYTFITMWRHITNRSLYSLTSNNSLMYHRQIRQIDVLIAQAFVEVISCSAAFAVAYIPLALLGFCPICSDPLNLVVGFYLTGLFSFGFGLLLAGTAGLNEIAHHITPAFMYLTLPFTGVFVLVDWMPESVQKFLLWSPLVNGSEMFRSGLFGPEVTFHFSVPYLLCSSVLVTIIGFFMFSYVESRVEE